MNTYLITFHLVNPENNYTGLINYLKTAPNWARPMKNVWIVKTMKETVELRNGLNVHLNLIGGDKVMVLRLKDGNWATNKISREVTDWMQRNL